MIGRVLLGTGPETPRAGFPPAFIKTEDGKEVRRREWSSAREWRTQIRIRAPAFLLFVVCGGVCRIVARPQTTSLRCPTSGRECGPMLFDGVEVDQVLPPVRWGAHKNNSACGVGLAHQPPGRWGLIPLRQPAASGSGAVNPRRPWPLSTLVTTHQ